MPLFWAALILFILVPCASSLLLAISPRLFDQGSQWFTLTYLRQAFTGATAIAITNSLWVSSAAAVLGLAIGFPIAWLAGRTTLPGRRFVAGGMWLVLLLPSWLPALGWERLVQPDGVMYRVGLDWPWVTHAIMGPFGVVLLLGLRSVPFTYLAVTAALAGLGQEFEDAARVHGASRVGTLRLIWPMLAPAIWSALAIGFAESISDFGVAATLAYNSNFTLATYQLYAAIGNFPPNFPARLGHGHAARRGRGHPAGPAGPGAARPLLPVAVRADPAGHPAPASRPAAIAAAAGVGLFYLIALGVPGFGAVSASLLGDYGGSFTLTLVNYRALLHEAGQIGPLERSLGYGDGHRVRRRWSAGSSPPGCSPSGAPGRSPPGRSTSCCWPRSRCPAWCSRPATSSPSTCRSGPGSASTCTRRPSCSSSRTRRPACRPTPGCWSARSPSCSPR